MAYRHSTNQNGPVSAGGVMTGTWPTVSAGDTAIAVCSEDASADTIGVPTGFTGFENTNHPSADGQSVRFAYKLNCTGSETGNVDFTGGTNNRDYIVQVMTLSGRDTASIAASAVNVNNSANASPATISANGVTAVSGDDLVWISALDNTDGTDGWAHTAPSGYSEKQDDARDWTACSMAVKENDGGGATGTVSGTATLAGKSTGYASILVRIPVAGGGAAGQPTTKRLGGVEFFAGRGPAQRGMRQW